MPGLSPQHVRTPRGARGSVLIVVVFVVSLLSALAVSASVRTTDLIESQENADKATRGMFAAESGIDHGIRRLAVESAWTETGTEPVPIAGDAQFLLSAQLVDPGSGEGLFRVSSEGLADEGRVQLEADVHLNYGVYPYADIALAFLGDKLDMEDSAIVGDLLITDKANVVDDWVFDANGDGYYAPGGPYGPFDIVFTDTTISGDLYKYTESVYGVGGQEHVISAHVKMPRYDLDEFLVPGPDRMIYHNKTNLKNVSHPETAVFVLKENHTLSLSNCDLPGGVVVYVEKDYDLRSGERNKIILKEGTKIGGGTGGVYEYLGILAPATEIQYAGNKHATGGAGGSDDVYGFVFVNKIFQTENYQFRGQVIVVNEIKNYDTTTLIFDPLVAENPPGGIEFDVPMGEADLVRLWEDYAP